MEKRFVICLKCEYFYATLCCGMICDIYGFPKYWLEGWCPSYKEIPGDC